MRIIHIIVGLDTGGAELMLKSLVKAQSKNMNIAHIVVSLTGLGEVGMRLKSGGIEVHALDMHSYSDIPYILWKLIGLMRSKAPNIIQTWMYHADLIGGIAGRVAGHNNIIWNVRSTGIPQKGISSTGILVFLCSILSYFLPKKIICNSESAIISHAKKGYDKKKMVVIPNGYDLIKFKNSPELKQKARKTFRFTKDEIIVGIVGRFDALKDYKNLVHAAVKVLDNYENVKFLMIGRGIDSENKILMDWITGFNIAKYFVLAGYRSDIPFCLSAMDIFCLSSAKESFPNVVCEAMLMNLPCVATNVGDASVIIGSTGIIVPPGDYQLLANGLALMIDEGREGRIKLGKQAREHIVENYSIQVISSLYNKFWFDTVNG